MVSARTAQSSVPHGVSIAMSTSPVAGLTRSCGGAGSIALRARAMSASTIAAAARTRDCSAARAAAIASATTR